VRLIALLAFLDAVISVPMDLLDCARPWSTGCRSKRPLTFPEKNKEGRAKLFHAERYRCIFPTRSYTRVPAKSVLLKEGE
jgi:hypothetical protein